MTDTKTQQKTSALVVGGTSGIGFAVARALIAAGTEVTIAGRSAERLARAAERLGGAGSVQLDLADEDSIAAAFVDHGFDHVVSTAIDAADAYQPVAGLKVDAAQRVLDAKLLGPLLLAKHASRTAARSLIFTSGFNAYRPAAGGSVVSAANGALESIARALAVELAPIRVNAVSPGWVDTELWEVLAGEQRAERLAGMAARLPVGRVAEPEDLAAAYLALIDNPHITGTVLHVDGGQRLI